MRCSEFAYYFKGFQRIIAIGTCINRIEHILGLSAQTPFFFHKGKIERSFIAESIVCPQIDLVAMKIIQRPGFVGSRLPLSFKLQIGKKEQRCRQRRQLQPGSANCRMLILFRRNGSFIFLRSLLYFVPILPRKTETFRKPCLQMKYQSMQELLKHLLGLLKQQFSH